jgi:hypothetical protein
MVGGEDDDHLIRRTNPVEMIEKGAEPVVGVP